MNPTDNNFDKPPLPAYQPITGPDDETHDLIPQLKRDDADSVQKTLKRIQSRTSNITTISGDHVVTTASKLPLDKDISKSKWLKYSIIFVVLALLFSIITSVTNQVNLPQFGGNNQSGTVINTAQKIYAIAPAIAMLQNSNDIQITFDLGDDTTTTSNTQFNRSVLNAIGLADDERLIQNIASTISIYKSDPNNFIVGFAIYDYPNALGSLRNWESQTNNFIFDHTNTFTWKDQQTEFYEYRTTDNLAYTIQNETLVLIGSSPEFIEQNQSIILSQIKPR